MAEAEVESFWQRQRLAEAEVKKPHALSLFECLVKFRMVLFKS